MKWLRKAGLVLILSILFVALLTPLMLRSDAGAPITPGPESYTYVSEAEGIVAEGANAENTMYGLLLSLMVLFGVPWLLPVVLSALFLVLLYLYVFRLTRNRTVSLLALIIIAVSPTISVLGTWHKPQLLGLVLLAAALLLFDKYGWLSLPFFVLGCASAPVTGALVLVWKLFRSKKKKLLTAVAAAVGSVGWFIWTGPVPYLRFFDNPFFEFGNTQGLSIFVLIFAAYGLLSPRVRKLQLLPYAAALPVLSFVVPELIPLTTAFLAVVAGYGIVYLSSNKWELELLRHILQILLFCLGLFLLIVSVRERVDENPTNELANTLIYMHTQQRPGNILTLPEYAPIVKYFSGHAATLSQTKSPEIFRTRDADEVYDFLEQTGTSHVIITEEMTETFFQHSDEGMLFLLPNTERFVMIYQNDASTLWYYIPRR